MSTLYVPRIAPADYQAFKAILGRHLPDTYDEWFQLAQKIELENQGMRNISEFVEVNPNEFERFRRATGAEANHQGLMNFAFQKGLGNKY